MLTFHAVAAAVSPGSNFARNVEDDDDDDDDAAGTHSPVTSSDRFPFVPVASVISAKLPLTQQHVKIFRTNFWHILVMQRKEKKVEERTRKFLTRSEMQHRTPVGWHVMDIHPFVDVHTQCFFYFNDAVIVLVS